jgi:3-hydroxyacyl-CoA dehydrogenase/enoyl-CoA hydratase/3-hydroxybutyryl-CoA epimerase
VKHWRIESDNGITLLTLDVAEQSANVLSQEVLREFDQILDDLESNTPRGVILRSAKRSGFIAGADVREFERISDAARAADLARAGQRVFARVARLSCPTVAVIHGYCLGGGLELALACRYRIGRETAGGTSLSRGPRLDPIGEGPDTRLGLPEVRLGINPGFGGTVRLPPLIGALPALDMMLTGRTLSASAARRLGLVDEVVPERHLLNAARRLIEKKPKPRRAPWLQRALVLTPLRPLVSKLVLRKVRAKASPDHYPAPYRIVDLWREHAGEEQEAISLGELLVSRTSRSLVHVFLLGEELKRRGRAQPHRIERVHVIGAGVMGADIAMVAAQKGFVVSLQDMNTEALGRAIKRAFQYFKERLKDPRAVQEAMDRLMPDARGDGLRRADLVIEAIVEKVEPKQKLLRDAEARAKPEAILATNTSSIPLETLAQALKDPARLVGIHFFNPVPKMQLVEIVRGERSGEEALNRARAFTVALDKLPLDVKSSPGFLVNRILMPYLLEAVQMVEEGVPGPLIDKAARDFGMPMGPIELSDTVGLDICLSVAEELAKPLNVTVPERLRTLVEAGKLGRKSGEGFYRYDKRGRARKASVAKLVSSPPVTERLVLRMLNEAVACLHEGVVADADAVDAGMVYGTGFAPFLGGPMRYIESIGETGIRHSLTRLAEEYGTRFVPHEGWAQIGGYLQSAILERSLAKS